MSPRLFTVVGYYPDNGQGYTEAVLGATPEYAAMIAQELNGDLVVIAVFEGDLTPLYWDDETEGN